MLNREKKSINGSKILLLGVAYKPDIDDLRESTALKVIEHLEKFGAELVINEPFVKDFKHNGKEYHSTDLSDQLIKDADIVVVLTNHSCYDAEHIVKTAKMVFDTRNLTKGIDADNLERL